MARFTIDDSSLCFINCHLAAGQNHKRQRNQDLAAILEEKAVFPDVTETSFEKSLAYVGGGDGSMILDHEICFVCPFCFCASEKNVELLILFAE